MLRNSYKGHVGRTTIRLKVKKPGLISSIFAMMAAAMMVNPVFARQSAIVSTEPIFFHSALEETVFEAGEKDMLTALFATDAAANEQLLEATKNNYSANLTYFKKVQSRYGNGHELVKMVFFRTHRKELKRYVQYSSFAGQAQTGSYDCLTATTLYYLYLTDLGFQPQIVETEYHIYLKVKTDDGPVLLESTDPLYGFVTSEKEIRSRETEYLGTSAPTANMVNGISSNTTSGRNGFLVNGHVDARELRGLHYYNLAIAAWNARESDEAYSLIQKSYFLYTSPRIEQLKNLFTENADLLARMD